VTLNATEEESIEAIKKWWDENGKQLLVAVIVVLGGYGGWSLWQNTELAASELASDLYEEILEISLLEAGESPTEQERNDIIRIANELMESHSDSVYAQYGALFASQQHVIGNDLDAAEDALGWILENPQTSIFGDEDQGLVLTVTLRLARIVLSRGDAERALGIVNNVIPGSFEAGYAELRGDIYYALGRNVDARESYVAAQQAGSVSEVLQLKLSELPDGN
tara:strand:+ start:354 stop:1022 length:669 start_codon:yes stop_codon:yes gene_type:complete